MPRLLGIVFSLLLNPFLVTNSWSQDKIPEADEFQEYLSRFSESEDIVGLAVAVVRNGEIESLNTYGLREVGTQAAIDANTVFRLASVSKGFTATIISQLVSEEKVLLSTPVQDFSQEFRLKKDADLGALNLEHILSHRTSLPPYAYDNLLEAGIPTNEIREKYRVVDPICPVGSCYAYQNVAFDTSRKLIEQKDHAPFAESLNQRLFGPLGMERASLGIDNLMADENWARPHRRKRGQPWRTVQVKEAYYRVPAAGGVNASLLDMTEWLTAQMGYRQDVVSTEALELMHSPRVSTRAETRRLQRGFSGLERSSYGLGWRIYKYNGQTVVSHFGSVDFGYGAQIAFIPERSVGIVVLTNSRSKEFAKIMPAFLDYELGVAANTGEIAH